jgi:hypothetical protein
MKMTVRAFALVVFYATLTAVVTYPQIWFLHRGIPDLVDAYFSIWRLAWIAHQLPHGPLHLFDANIFFPERLTLAYSDAVLAPGLVMAPLFWIGVSPVLIYNLVLLAGFTLSGVATFALVKELTRDTAAALLGGAFFVCAPYRFDHYVHLELQLTMFMPIALWALHRTIRTARWSAAVFVAVALAMQTFCSIYYGIFFGTLFCLMAVLLVIAEARVDVSRVVKLLGAAALLTAVLVVPYLPPYLAARQTVGVRADAEVLYYSAVPRDYLASHPDNWLYGRLLKLAAGGGEERHLFPGVGVLIFAGLALWPPVSRTVLVYVISCTLAFEASLGLHGYVFRWLRDWLLPYRGTRVPARFGMLVAMLLAVMAGYGVSRALKRTSRAGRFLLAAIVLVVMVLETRTLVPLTAVPTRPAVVDTWLRAQAPSVIVELPVPPPNQPFQESEGKPLYHSVFHWQKLVNGTSGFFPPSYLDLLDHMRSFPDRESIRYLRVRGVRFIVVRQAMFEPNTFARLAEALGERSELLLAGRFPERVGASLVYEVRGDGAAADEPSPSSHVGF